MERNERRKIKRVKEHEPNTRAETKTECDICVVLVEDEWEKLLRKF